MSFNKSHIILILLMLCALKAYSQEGRTEINIDFRTNSSYIDPKYSDNAEHLQNIIDLYNSLSQDTALSIVEVSFCGSVSPDGSYQYNRKLAKARLLALEKTIRQKISIPDNIITYNDNYISWDNLKNQVTNSNLKYKDEILAILNEEATLVDYHLRGEQVDNRVVKLKRLDDGNVWRQLNKHYFNKMRNAYAVFITFKKEDLIPEPEVSVDTVVTPEPVIVETVETVLDTPVVADPIIVDVEEWNRKLHVKTNALGWGMLISNIAAEIDLAQHWSVTLPVYYSALNYFTSSVKFRTLGIQPEARYWISEDNSGIFVGAHFGVAQYNIAVDGDYRYQDKDGKNPAIGGGISIGYRKPITEDKKWNIEFSFGAGAYSLNYDTFYNVNKGVYINTQKKTYWGIDQAAITFSYSFDLQKKGGKR
ncbi:MAG: DUF3575 domain-containing protein [Paludibacteraceae bacterium]|nr:DUF3575 domain-containing protein [Paludibacteraceae bacterium]